MNKDGALRVPEVNVNKRYATDLPRGGKGANDEISTKHVSRHSFIPGLSGLCDVSKRGIIIPKLSNEDVSPAATCSPYPTHCQQERLATFVIPAALRKLTLLDVEVTVRAYGSLEPVRGGAAEAVWEPRGSCLGARRAEAESHDGSSTRVEEA